MKLFKGQIFAIEQLFENYINGEKVVDFKAPTGSGKTFMAASFISKMITNKKPNEKMVFVIATVSSSELPKQFENKLREYQKYLESPFNVERVESPSSSDKKIPKDFEPKIIAEDSKVIILGKSSFGKGRILSDRGAFDSFIGQVLHENFKLIYIRDEAHIGAGEKSLGKDNEENLLHNNADYIVRMTATPTSKNKQIILKEKDLIDEETNQSLLKTEDIFNLGIKASGKKEIDSNELLQIAIDEFKKIKTEYQGSGVNPAMLIQINSLSENLSEEGLEEIVTNYKKIISQSGLQWATYYGDKKETSTLEGASLNKISSATSSIDVVIFKVGPATGWDIPRACMLVQLREVSSETLNQQTVGRIKRNPIKDLKITEFSNKYYIYSNYQESSREMFQYNLRSEFVDTKIPVVLAKENSIKSKKALSILEVSLDEWFSKEAKNIELKFLDTFYEENKSLKSRVAFHRNKYIDSTKKEQQIVGYKYVNNVLQLKIEIDKFLDQYHREWSILKPYLTSFYQTMNGITFEQFQFILITHYWSSLLEIFAKKYADEMEYEYSINDARLKSSYVIWGNKSRSKEEDLNLLNFESVKKNYAYLNTDNSWTYYQALDSNPERIFMKSVIEFIKAKGDEFPVDVWAKNPSLGNEVFLSYKNSVGSLSKAFIDFVFKIGEKIIYVEVKGVNDYDPVKTEKIIEAVMQWKGSDDPRIKNIEFAIAKIDKDDENVKKPLDYKMTFFMADDQLKKLDLTISDFFKMIKKI